MKPFLLIIFIFISSVTISQNVITDSNTYTAQELIEDILIGSNCISDVVVTNVIGGNFNGTDESYGYFDANGSAFPFQNGVVLSTGKLTNVQGPNTTLSDDDAPNWIGDSDLENALNESNTLNATILEFNFRAVVANQIRFRYLFASEEYQEGNANTCRYSDLFGFLIRKVGETNYENIAVIPDTQTPVKVTTVHSGIPGSCDPINESYFGSWNDANAPINFNGQTTVLTATANVIPNETYHVKLVIADEQNYRYDSAVFLEAGGFQLATDIGPDLLISNGTALCENETVQLQVTEPGNTNTYKWFKDGVEQIGETNTIFNVIEAGIYSVEVTINGCILNGEAIIEYVPNPIVSHTTLVACDSNLDGFTNYNLFDTLAAITNSDNSLTIENFYLSQIEAESGASPIPNPTSYENTSLMQIVYARVLNSNGCISIAEVTLDFANNAIILPSYDSCDDNNDGILNFDLNDISNFVISQNDVPNSASVIFYNSQNDLENQENGLSGTYENIDSPYLDTLYVQIIDNGMCYGYTSINLIVFHIPELEPDEETIYCLNTYPDTITLEAGILNGLPSDFNYQWELGSVDLMQNSEQILVNETGIYTVTVTNNDGCSNSRTITVLPSNIATIDDVYVTEASNNNSITIQVSGEGDYEYALDTGSFQNSNVFTNVSAGFHTIYVIDKNGCGIVSEEVSVLGFPKFFTPNGDGYNDYWKPVGLNYLETHVIVKVYNRYGKLIKELSAFGSGWNGTFKGESLPSDDYWFVVTLTNGKEYRGHFTLKR